VGLWGEEAGEEREDEVSRGELVLLLILGGQAAP